MNRFAIVTAFDGPLEAAQSLQRQIEIYTMGGEVNPFVQHVTLHQNMMADDMPFAPFVKVEPAKPCEERIWHGPGHQSSTRCRVAGDHEIHEAVYGEFNRFATWRSKPDGKHTFSDAFDEPPHEEDA